MLNLLMKSSGSSSKTEEEHPPFHDGKIGSLEYKQDLANAGVWYLCNMVGGKKVNMPEALQEQLKLSGKSRALLTSGTPTPKGLKNVADILSVSKKYSGRDEAFQLGADGILFTVNILLCGN
ncbi:hypothetical protein F3Y22_tig00003103pilonHSYRG00023 [Hibiscus syriacus]|uniref:Uncharacterized protein n=1 Tax=Hibiscus syriacus TaxID=106335 RepID=A0A6A3CRS6_HIBSY|nr:hypothetical protein F3Y22_tig00003103pilonHSYRG00023 [Hibiscus syriacus]